MWNTDSGRRGCGCMRVARCCCWRAAHLRIRSWTRRPAGFCKATTIYSSRYLFSVRQNRSLAAAAAAAKCTQIACIKSGDAVLQAAAFISGGVVLSHVLGCEACKFVVPTLSLLGDNDMGWTNIGRRNKYIPHHLN